MKGPAAHGILVVVLPFDLVVEVRTAQLVERSDALVIDGFRRGHRDNCRVETPFVTHQVVVAQAAFESKA